MGPYIGADIQDMASRVVILAGVMVLLFIRSFVEIDTFNPYIMGSFLLYYSYFKLVRVPVARPRWAAADLAEPETAGAKQSAKYHIDIRLLNLSKRM